MHTVSWSPRRPPGVPLSSPSGVSKKRLLTGQGFVSHDMISLSVHAGKCPPIYEHRKEAKHMSKKWAAVIISLLVISLGLSAVSLAVSLRQPPEQTGDIQYVLYLGTNDKDTNQPVYPPEEAKEKAKEILIRNFGGYTIQEANGGWIDDENTVYQEYTLVIYLSVWLTSIARRAPSAATEAA